MGYRSVRPYNLTAAGEPVTLEKVQEVFLYGALAHSSKREQYKQWEENRAAYPVMRFFFDSAVATVIETIFGIAFLTELELRGKEIPPRRSLFRCARLTRTKDASKWRVLTTHSQMAQCRRGLEEQLATTAPIPYDETNEPVLTFTK